MFFFEIVIKLRLSSGVNTCHMSHVHKLVPLHYGTLWLNINFRMGLHKQVKKIQNYKGPQFKTFIKITDFRETVIVSCIQ